MCSTPNTGVLLPCSIEGGSLPPPGTQGESSGEISPSLALVTVLFPLQVQALIVTTCTSTSRNLRLSNAVLQHDLLAHSLASRGRDPAFYHVSILLRTSVPQSWAQAPPCWLLPRPQILCRWADRPRDMDSPSSERAQGQASSPESSEPQGSPVWQALAGHKRRIPLAVVLPPPARGAGITPATDPPPELARCLL